MTFDDWMLTKDKSYVPTDDSMPLRLLRECWFSRDAEIADLKVVSDHNLKVYQEAASKMRAEIATLSELVEEMTGRNISNQLAIKLLREKVTSRDAEIAELKEELELCCEIREGTTMGEQRLVRWVEMQEEIAALREQLAATEPKEIPE